MKIEDLGEEEGLDDYTKPSKTLLVDADTIVFAAASTSEYADDLLPRDMYSDDEWGELIEAPGYDEEGECIWEVNLDEAMNKIEEKLLRIKGETNTKDIELYFTEGRNFRYDVEPMYKANRKKIRYPQGLGVLKRMCLERYKGEICIAYEADDKVVMLKRTQPEKYVLCAVDKDVYKSLPGKHFNYYESSKYGIDMKWVETESKDAHQFPYIQTLMGDSTDNIKGCPGIGPKKAEKALNALVTPCDMWREVVRLFKSKKLTIKDAIRDMRLVNMHQLDTDGKTINLWNPPCEAE